MNASTLGTIVFCIALSGCASTGGHARSSDSSGLEQLLGTAVDAAGAAYNAKKNYEYTRELYQELRELYEQSR